MHWDSRPCATKHEKDGKVYVERVDEVEVNEVSSRPCTFFASIAAAPLSLILINLATDFTGVVAEF